MITTKIKLQLYPKQSHNTYLQPVESHLFDSFFFFFFFQQKQIRQGL